jgi:hypothetical protein
MYEAVCHLDLLAIAASSKMDYGWSCQHSFNNGQSMTYGFRIKSNKLAPAHSEE